MILHSAQRANKRQLAVVACPHVQHRMQTVAFHAKMFRSIWRTQPLVNQSLKRKKNNCHPLFSKIKTKNVELTSKPKFVNSPPVGNFMLTRQIGHIIKAVVEIGMQLAHTECPHGKIFGSRNNCLHTGQ